jgi:hypothetical protein
LTQSGQPGYTLNEPVDWKKKTLPKLEMVPRNDSILSREQHNMER